MDIPSTKKPRSQLKGFFVKNAIPTESNFADLIEGAVNQRDDGLVKTQDTPLSIQAGGDDNSQKRVLAFYNSFRDPQPLAVMNLAPFEVANNPATKVSGLGISDASGNTKVFIDPTRGQVGLGTLKPSAGLDVRTGPNNTWFSAGPGGDAGRVSLGLGKAKAPELKISDKADPSRIRFSINGNGTEAAPQFTSWIGMSAKNSPNLTIMAGGGPGGVGIGTKNIPAGIRLMVYGSVYSLMTSVNNGANTGVDRGLRLWNYGDSNHAIYSANPSGKSTAGRNAVRGHWDANHRFRLRTARNQGFLFENDSEAALVDIDSDNGNLWSRGNIVAGGSLTAGGSDIYFTQTNHSHTGAGNLPGYAAIENDGNSYKALMILGRNIAPRGKVDRMVKLWNQLEVYGKLMTRNGSHLIKVGHKGGKYGYDGIRGEPNLWLDAKGRVIIKKGYTTNAMDVAERFPVKEETVPGDVMVYDESLGAVRKCTDTGEDLVIGIASGDPGFILGMNEKDVPIALCGRLPCKVDADFAPIKAGDLLMTSPTKGHAQKCEDRAKHQGAIIGKALESLNNGKGEILVFVMPR